MDFFLWKVYHFFPDGEKPLSIDSVLYKPRVFAKVSYNSLNSDEKPIYLILKAAMPINIDDDTLEIHLSAPKLMMLRNTIPQKP